MVKTSVVDIHHLDADKHTDPDSTDHPDADPDSHFLSDNDPDSTFTHDADPDPDPSIQIKAQTIEKVPK